MLHGCAHNPTGADLTKDQWTRLGSLFLSRQREGRGLVAFFDIAYQGFASGSLENDAWAVRHFSTELGIPTLVAQSFSKSMGLYGERVGCVHVVCPGQDAATATTSQLGAIARRTYSNPPTHGVKLATAVLSDEGMYEQWGRDLETMSGRIKAMRHAVRDGLKERGCPGLSGRDGWDHLTSQIGMFAYTGLSPEQVTWLEINRHVYMADTGRISVAGLNSSNVEWFVESVDAVMRAGV